MSALSIGSAGSLPAAAQTPIDVATEPAVIRNGSAKAKSAYQTGLAFEQLLVNQLEQALSKTVSSGSGTDGSSDGSDGSDGSGDGSTGSGSGLMGTDPATSTYQQMLPQALTSGIMSAGGTGIALQIAKGIDPSIGAKP